MRHSRFLMLGLVGAASLGLAACDVEKTASGNVQLPEYEVTKTQEGEVKLPAYDVRTPDVDVTTTERQVTVPDVDINTRKETVTVPSIDITPAPDRDDGRATMGNR